MSQDYFRPRGDITTVLDATDRDAQDNTYFPLDATSSFFHRGGGNKSPHPSTPQSNPSDSTESPSTVYPTTFSIQEFPQRGPSNWGQTLSFELGSLHAGDLLQSVMVQLTLGSWYDDSILTGLLQNRLTASVSEQIPPYESLPVPADSSSTASIVVTPLVLQIIPVSLITLIQWGQTNHTTGSTGLTYASGLFTNGTSYPIMVRVEYTLLFQQLGDGSSFVGINGLPHDVRPNASTMASATYAATLAPGNTLGIYYMDNGSPILQTASTLTLTITTVGAPTFSLPSAELPGVPITGSIDYSQQYWTYSNSLGTCIIEYADFIVKDQTIERITGEFIMTQLAISLDQNEQFGVATDAVGAVPPSYLNPSTVAATHFHPSYAFPTEDGVYFCVLPFFFLRTKLKETFPLLSCNEGDVRIDIKLRSFDQMVRKYVGYRESMLDSPLSKTVSFLSLSDPLLRIDARTSSQPPAFRDFRLVTGCVYTTGSIRNKLMRSPFEQMVKLMQPFHFEEPLKYIVNKTTDAVTIQLPLELNHPVVELLWVFRRKAVRINNEWSNFGPALSYESTPSKRFVPWLKYASLRANGMEIVSASGDWFRQNCAAHHRGGLTAYQSHVYGYSFAERPDDHQPTGSANMSRASSVSLTLTVNPPSMTVIPGTFDESVGGWEVFVYAMHYNWLRFENGMCNRMFST
jgi:hypothetical protein